MLKFQYKNIRIKIIFLILFVLLSVILLFPRCKNLIEKNGLFNTEENTINYFLENFDPQSYFQSVGIPLVIKFTSYNLEINNRQDKYDFSYTLLVDESDPIIPYLEKSIGTSTEILQTDNNVLFTIEAGKIYQVKNIPLTIVTSSKRGALFTCGFTNKNNICPILEESYKKSLESMDKVDILVCPNIEFRSLILQTILIALFGIITINGLYEFFRTQ